MNLTKYIIILLIILIILVNLIKYNDEYKKENYDGRIKRIETIEDCADIASSIYDVTGFAYNDKTKNCYISKKPLTRPPLQLHPYHNDFKLDDNICNKTNYIRKELDTFNKENMIDNRLYLCYNNTINIDDNIDQIYFAKNKKAQLLNYRYLGNLPTERHNFFNIDWATNRKELNDIEIKYNVNSDGKEITDIIWKPAVIDDIIEENVYDIYDDTNNYNLFNINKINNKNIKNINKCTI